MELQNGQISYWRSRATVPGPSLPSVSGDLCVDVAVVGAGLTGLWTAWALVRNDPSLKVAVFEAETIGYGASGRNGGWLSAKPVGMRPVLARGPGGRAGVQAVDRILARSIHEVVDVLGAENIDAKHGGWMEVARTPSELARIEQYLAKSRAWGVPPERLRLLSGGQAHERVAVDGVRGALYSPDSYRVDPYKMLLALAERAVEQGVAIYTGSRVDSVSPGRLRVHGFEVRASRQIVIATEGYSRWERGQRRQVLPMNSAMVITDPLTDDQWAKIGWEEQEGLGGAAHMFFYAQRTADGRIAIGGRGRPYKYASGFDRDGHVHPATVAALAKVLTDIFPQVDVRPIHAWCGVLGVTRDWSPFVDSQTTSGVTRVGGYAGQGLTASYVAGCTVADLLTDKRTELAASPWVRHAPRAWEPEPLRWLGANGLYKAYSIADRIETRSQSDRTAWPARMANLVAGR